MSEIANYMQRVSKLRAEIKTLKTQLKVVSEMYDNVHTERDKLQEQLDAVMDDLALQHEMYGDIELLVQRAEKAEVAGVVAVTRLTPEREQEIRKWATYLPLAKDKTSDEILRDPPPPLPPGWPDEVARELLAELDAVRADADRNCQVLRDNHATEISNLRYEIELGRSSWRQAQNDLNAVRAELGGAREDAAQARLASAEKLGAISQFEMPELETLEKGVNIFGRTITEDVNTPEGGDPEGYH